MSTPPQIKASHLSTSTPTSTFPVRSYKSRHQNFPYTSNDFSREDESEDEDFYSTPRFVTHIDDHAIATLRQYYARVLPDKGRILDLCSSWISHFPKELEERARARITRSEDGRREQLEVIGLGMNRKELDANPILSQRLLRNLNTKPEIPENLSGNLDATVCVVSIDYMTSPVEVLESIRKATKVGGKVHLVISNRCFPTKAVRRWLRVGEQERLDMVGEYLWWSGWREVEIEELCDGTLKEGESAEAAGGLGAFMQSLGMGSGRVDPLWVVRGVRITLSEAEGHVMTRRISQIVSQDEES